MNQLTTKKRSKKGFTLMEMLIVVAIIAILIAIAIPVFNTQLDNAKAQVDAANLRSATSMAVVDYLSRGLTGDKPYVALTDGNDTMIIKQAAAKDASETYYPGKTSTHSTQHILVTVGDGGKVTSGAAVTGWVN